MLSVCDTIGVMLVIVGAKEKSASFYEKFGFSKLVSDESSYYLLMDTLKAALK